MERFRIREAWVDAWGHFRKGFGKLLANWLVVFMMILIPIIISVMALSAVMYRFALYGAPNMATLLLAFVIGLPLSGLILAGQGIFVKIADDVIENRDMTYGDQFKYVFKRFWRLVGAQLLASLPILILALIGFFIVISLPLSFYIGNASMFLVYLPMFLVAYIYSVFIVMIQQAVIIEDLSATEAISRSFSIMSKNFFKYAGFMLIIVFISMIGEFVLGDKNVLINVLKFIINIVFGTYMFVFKTTLFKQVSGIKNQPTVPEYEFFDEFE